MGKGHHNISTYHPGSGSSSPNNPASTPAADPAGGTGGSAPNSYSSMYAQQKRDEAKAKAKAANRYVDQAQVLQQQVLGLRKALGVHGFKHRLDIQLKNLDLEQALTDRLVMHDYRSQLGGLERSVTDNNAASDTQTNAALVNKSRERAAALSEATANGAGESDLLRAQSMSLANWNANQNEVNRSFYDTRTSINASLDELNSGTYKARIGNVMQTNKDRETDWNSYYDRRSEALTQLGNTLGQQAEYYGLAYEQVSNKKWKGHQHQLGVDSGRAYGRASKSAGMGYSDPGVSKKLLKWQGHDEFDDRLNNSNYHSASTELVPKKPEGAGLRSWTA